MKITREYKPEPRGIFQRISRKRGYRTRVIYWADTSDNKFMGLGDTPQKAILDVRKQRNDYHRLNWWR